KKSDCSRDRNQYNHQQSPCLADTAQQPVERAAQTNENYVSEEITDDRKTKHRLVSQDVVGGGGGISAHDEFAGDIQQSEWRGEYHREINRPGDARGFLGWMHASFSFLFLEIRRIREVHDSDGAGLLPR